MSRRFRMRTRALRAAAALLSIVAARVPLATAQDDLDALLGESEKVQHEEPQAPEPVPSPAPEAAEAVAPASHEPRSEEEPPAQRKEGPARRVIEEIIVTAQKTEQSLRDVPISMSVLNDEFMKQEGIADLQDLTAYVPNASLNANPFLPDIRIRGFGSEGLNKGFEQSVGLVLDGVPYGRQQYFQSALFDVERVEVLRGPQGTLFGKNTSAGLFNITTKNPTDDYGGSIGLQLGELDRRQVEAAVGGPILPNLLNFRLAGILDERDGFVRNTTARVVPQADPRMGERDRGALRAKLAFPDLFGANLVLSYERIDLHLTGASVELGIVPDELIPFYEAFDPDFDAISGNFIGSIDHPIKTDVQTDTFTANASYDIGGWGLDAVSGHSRLDVVESADFDLGPSPMFFSDPRRDDNAQTTFEARLSSPSLAGSFGLERLFGFGLGRSELTLGFFYQRRTLDDGIERLGIDTVVVAEFLAAQGGPPVVAPPIEGAGPAVEVSTLFFDQTSNAIAGFGQGSWHLGDRWTLQFGLRFSNEKKEGQWQRTFDSGPNPFMTAALGFEEFTADLDRSEFFTTPKVSLQYDWTDDLGLFASWGKGFKAGGFNAWLTATDNPDRLQFEPERAESWELGAKTRLLDGTATGNLALFWMSVEDFQELTASPNDLEQFVENAAEARSRGVEADLTWFPTGWLDLRAAVGFNDAEFLDFPIGGCPPDRENTDDDEDPRCDLSGEPLFRTPKWTATVTPGVAAPIESIPFLAGILPSYAGGLSLGTSLNIEYQSSKFVARFRDPRVVQPSFVRLDGTIGLRNVARGWSLGFTVKNITDEFVLARRDDVVLSAQLGGPGAFWQFVEPPRLFFGEFRWEF